MQAKQTTFYSKCVFWLRGGGGGEGVISAVISLFKGVKPLLGLRSTGCEISCSFHFTYIIFLSLIDLLPVTLCAIVKGRRKCIEFISVNRSSERL